MGGGRKVWVVLSALRNHRPPPAPPPPHPPIPSIDSLCSLLTSCCGYTAINQCRLHVTAAVALVWKLSSSPIRRSASPLVCVFFFLSLIFITLFQLTANGFCRLGRCRFVFTRTRSSRFFSARPSSSALVVLLTDIRLDQLCRFYRNGRS